MTQKVLQALVVQYQPILKLRDWDIKARFLKKSESPNGDNCGMIYWFREFSQAHILVARDDDDPEHTIVHEMCHLKLEGHKDQPDPYNKHREAGLNDIAEAIIGRPSRSKAGFLCEDTPCKRKH